MGGTNTKSPRRSMWHQLGGYSSDIEQDGPRITLTYFRSEVGVMLWRKRKVRKKLVGGTGLSWDWGEKYFKQRPVQRPRGRRERVTCQKSRGQECYR